MSHEDRKRWDKKWSQLIGKPFNPHRLLIANQGLFSGGRALEVACGLGQNAIWLADHHYQVTGIDISCVALAYAANDAAEKKVSSRISFVQMDLDSWSFPTDTFDLITVFRFLNRELFPGIRAGLRSGGLLIYSTRFGRRLDYEAGTNQDYILHPGELIDRFSDWEILYYGEGQKNAEIIARKK